MRFVDDTAGTTVTVINCSGSNFHIEGCEIELGAKSLVGISHDTTGKAGFTAINNLFFSTQNGPNNAIVFEKDHDNFVIQGNRFQFTGGCDDGVILYTSGDVGAGGWVDNNVCIGLANAEVFVLQTKLFLGLVSNNLIVGADATDNLGASPASGAGFIDNFVTEPGLGVPGIADHAGARPINTTPAS